MLTMFFSASAFNVDLSKWDVSRVTNMREMFSGASSFKKTLSGVWVTSTANKFEMFKNSPGRLCPTSMDSLMTTDTSNQKIRKELHSRANDQPQQEKKNT